ncbi:peptide/nickel transport system substrate-binding protein [Microbacterium azadirachtae]|uniref:Peptide/nickel transport system substrate-binding protein n=1 Tax=Microbacterium azadirachtae TaxID=582680 RepID=A0A1I6HIA5_9MICO|nr:ABC transporter substrate-binding protein [Microbacterium azadirachtae]SFR54242.1 peptide/nickel transport system substrate-binding protein [Microbacterium azadirachtae]
MTRTRLVSGASRHLIRVAAAGAAALVAAASLTACSGGSAGGASATAEWKLTTTTAKPSGDIDSFSFALYAEPATLDYAYAFDYPDNQVLANVCESLLRLNPDYSLSPGLAKSFANPDPLTWVYELRDGVTFHDGTPLTAADAVASMQRIMDPQVGSSWFSVYQNVESITQTGPMEVTVKTKIPDSQFNQGMGGSAGVIESAATLAAKGKDYGNSTAGVNCTGPFALKAWKSGESLTLERYDGYWDKELRAKSKEMTFSIIPDATARVNAMKSGSVDGSWQIPMESAAQLQASGKGDVLYAPSSATSDLVVSNMKGVLGDKRVRQALMMALDRPGILKGASQGVGEISDVLTTKLVWGTASEAAKKTAFDDITRYKQDVAKAKKLVEEAGATGKELVYVTAPIGNDFSVVSQATLAAAQSIGLKLTIKTVSPAQYTALFSDPSAREGVDLFYTVWYLSSPDALEMYGVLRTGDFSNYGGWSDAEFDKTVNEAVGTMDPAARSALTAKAQQIANEELPWLPLATGPLPLFLGKRITGLDPSMAFLYYPWAAQIGKR